MRTVGYICAAAVAALLAAFVVANLEDFQAKAIARGAVRLELREPEAAKFSELETTRTGAICGRVNARNGYGGMTGAKRFIVARDQAPTFEELEDPAVFDALWINAGCAKR